MAAYTSHATIDEAIDAAQPPRDVVREQLRRILAEPTFQASGPRRAFLRFVVEETLAGRADRLKGFTIAQAVFDRDDDFDPQTDPVVRVEARRLRHDLDGYYAGPGRCDQLIISIPKGGYLPRFDTREIEADGLAGTTGSSTAMSGMSRTAFGRVDALRSAPCAFWMGDRRPPRTAALGRDRHGHSPAAAVRRRSSR